MRPGDNAIPETTRRGIIDQARKYVGTPFNDKGRTLGVGLDCVGLLLAVGEDLGLLDRDGRPILRADYTDYSQHPIGTFVQDEMMRRLDRKPLIYARPGDPVTIRIPRFPCHVGFLADRDNESDLYLIHAYSAGPEKCVEHILDPVWFSRLVCAFSIPGVTD